MADNVPDFLELENHAETAASGLVEIGAALSNDNGNLTDAICWLAESAEKVQKAICRPAAAWPDPNGGEVGDLTEAGISISKALNRIADAIDRLAGAVEGRA